MTLSGLGPEWIEEWQERAAIMEEADPGLSPEEADRLALQDIRRRIAAGETLGQACRCKNCLENVGG